MLGRIASAQAVTSLLLKELDLYGTTYSQLCASLFFGLRDKTIANYAIAKRKLSAPLDTSSPS